MLAVIVVVPVATELASPSPAIVATFTFDEFQLTCVVRFSTLPSLKFPVALNCCVPPSGMEADVGAIVSETSVASLTVRVAVPTAPANTAVIVAVPGSSPVAHPFVPSKSLTVATDTGCDVHPAEPVRSSVLPSANVPVALNCVAVCCAIVAISGVIWIDTRAKASTTNAAEPVTESSCAEIVAVPADCPVTSPILSTLATLPDDELHVTAVVIDCVLPSLNVPVAEQASDDAGASTAVAGVTAMEVSVAELTFNGVDPVTPSSVALMSAVPAPTPVTSATGAIVATAVLSDAHVTSRVMT